MVKVHSMQRGWPQVNTPHCSVSVCVRECESVSVCVYVYVCDVCVCACVYVCMCFVCGMCVYGGYIM